MATPGLTFIFANFLKLATLLSSAYVVRYTLQNWLQLTVSNVHFFSVVLACLPLFVAIKSLRNEFINSREAARLGADRLKSWDGKWPGNFDLVRVLLKRFEDGYPGSFHCLGYRRHAFF